MTTPNTPPHTHIFGRRNVIFHEVFPNKYEWVQGELKGVVSDIKNDKGEPG